MNKKSLLALCLITLLGITSCDREAVLVPQSEKDEVRTMKFNAHAEDDVTLENISRTGVQLKLIHTWIHTDAKNIHLFETNNVDGNILEGEDVTIETEEPYEFATLTAGFYNSIIVEPETKASLGTTYTYTGIVAQKNSDNRYFIPAVQYPQSDSWIDPAADFLIGKAFVSASSLSEKNVDFSFQRAAAASRLAITNIEGTYIKSVTITSDDELTGSAGYFDIDFENRTANFTGGSKTLKMVFNNTKVSGTTYANFISSTGKKHVTQVVVETDKYIYTKTLNANTTFNKGTFTNIAMDMTPKEGVCTRKEICKQPLMFDKGGEEIHADEYDLASGDAYVSPVFRGAVEGAEVTFSSGDEEIATVAKGEDGALIVTPIAVGEVEISATATAALNYDETTISYTLTITDSSIPVDQTLEFSQTEFDYTYGEGDFTKPELTGFHTTVSYSSSAEDIATVDAANGDVSFTGTKGGTVTITATAQEGEVAGTNYNEGTASYTINVTVPTMITSQKFYKVAPADIEVGKSYLIVSNGKALKNNNGSVAAADVTDISGVIELEDYDDLVWTVGNSLVTDTDYPGYTYSNGENMLNRNSGNIQLTNASNNKYYNFAYAEDGTSGNYTFRCGTHYYTGYNDGWKAPTNKVHVTLYCSEKPKTSRDLTFAQTSVQKNVDDSPFTIELTGEKTGVVYSSDKTSVATVNSSTGEVVIVGEGTATITAEADETETLKAGMASFTLTVTDPSKVTTYTKVTTAPSDWSGTYLFVKESSNVALAYDQTNFKTSVTINSGKIQSNDLEKYQITVSKSTIEGMYDVKASNGQFIYWYNKAFLNDQNTKSSNTYYCSFSLSNGGNVTMYSTRTGGGSVNYITYDNSKFTFNSTTTNTIQLYKLEGGSTPTPPTPSGDAIYKKVSSVTSGKTYLVVNKGNTFALKFSSNNSTSNNTSVSPSGDIITAQNSDTYKDCEFIITADNGNYTFLSANNSKYLAWYNGSQTYLGFYESGSTTNPITFTLPKGNEATTGGLLYFKSTKSGSKTGGSYDEWLYYNSGSTCFKIGNSGNPEISGKTDQGVILYEKQ